MPPEDDLTLSNLKPAQERKARKRVGRGMGSGKGRYAGRGIKGQKARTGSHRMRAGFEGGQMPVYMRLGKQRGPYSKDAMPIGPHRTFTVPVNVAVLEQKFEDGDDVTLEALVARGVIKNTRTDVKILGNGELTKRLSVSAHAFSKAAREKIEAAGGTATALRGDRRGKQPEKAPETEAAASTATAAGAKGTAREPDESVDAEPQGAAQAAEGEG